MDDLIRPVHGHFDGKQAVLFGGPTSLPPREGSISFSTTDNCAYLYRGGEWVQMSRSWESRLVNQAGDDLFAMFEIDENPFGLRARFRRWADDEIIYETTPSLSPGVVLIRAMRHYPVDWSANGALPF